MDIRGTSREGIVDAAHKVFLQDGVAGMSMRKVAGAAGITAPAIYRHFQNREALLGEIVEIGLRELERYLRPALKSGTPYERVRKLADRYLEFALEQPDVLRGGLPERGNEDRVAVEGTSAPDVGRLSSGHRTD